MIEATDAPVTTENVIVPGSLLLTNTAYKFIGDDTSSSIKVMSITSDKPPHYGIGYYNNNDSNGTFTLNNSVSLLKLLVSYLYLGLVV